VKHWDLFIEEMKSKASEQLCSDVKRICHEIDEIPEFIVTYVLKEYIRNILKWCHLIFLKNRISNKDEINKYCTKKKLHVCEIEDLISGIEQ
jgi:hypothetical protein